jgi:hypothetical protein
MVPKLKPKPKARFQKIKMIVNGKWRNVEDLDETPTPRPSPTPTKQIKIGKRIVEDLDI